jgi:S-adenosylmethionine:tRNA ribosyltransferase-isomerase
MTVERATGKRAHRMVEDLPEILLGREFCGRDGKPPLLVFNNSKVRKARLIGKSETGAEVEFLLLERAGNGWKSMAHRAKRRKPGSSYTFFDTGGAEIAKARITNADGEFRFLEFDKAVDDSWLDRYGHIPLPPYIKRNDVQSDADRYQTVYARVYGSSAAPTAGLHFTNELLERLAAAGIESAFVTLHVGLGTFLPVRTANIEDHVMHREIFSIDEQNACKIEEAKAAGRRVIAVGTTSVRTLESAMTEDGRLKRGEGGTSIFIYPGYEFKAADALFTNFHTPESTLLMLVSAFAGRELVLESYGEAIRENYRFFSYGDAMLVY